MIISLPKLHISEAVWVGKCAYRLVIFYCNTYQFQDNTGDVDCRHVVPLEKRGLIGTIPSTSRGQLYDRYFGNLDVMLGVSLIVRIYE